MIDVVGFAGKPEHLHPSSVSNSRTDEITRLRADLTKAEHIIAAYELVSVQRGADLSAAITRANHAEADLAAVTEERDRMWEALKRIDGMATTICMRADAGYGMTVETVMPIYETARAAIEGVKEPASPWRDIESAPRDGTRILAFAAPLHGTEILAFSRGHIDYYGVAEWAEADPNLNRPKGVWIWDFLIRPTHWMPLPEPPR